ncbi:ribosomal RNA large subunit methyltransferase J [Myxozyma melibiosi]|uniref:rRNA methyltransferase 2, mitochondrial n=1 Tax=Myxozyma melibiosi TaxID=54550 RepID=A0ABR1F0J6_9ASCO
MSTRSLQIGLRFSRGIFCSYVGSSCWPLQTTIKRTKVTKASSKRWVQRQGSDMYAREAKEQGLRSRAAFKLLEIDQSHKIFKAGQTVIDLGFAPGSWTQVAVDHTRPNGRVLGIDILPAAPPKGAIAVQGDFMSPLVQAGIKEYLENPDEVEKRAVEGDQTKQQESGQESGSARTREKQSAPASAVDTVDVMLSDMLMNTSGNAFRDHATSMDLSNVALDFALDTLRPGGSFVCKFYAGGEDSLLERRLRSAFDRVKREKPAASRGESREQYFVATGKKKRRKVESVKGGGGRG